MSILAIAFQDDLKAHQTARVLAEWQAKGRVELTCAAIINRAPSGKLVVRQIGRRHREATGAGALFGTLTGVPDVPLAAWIGVIPSAPVASAPVASAPVASAPVASTDGGSDALEAKRAEMASFVAGITIIVADVATADDAALIALFEGSGGTVQVL